MPDWEEIRAYAAAQLLPVFAKENYYAQDAVKKCVTWADELIAELKKEKPEHV